jgi:VIT1/CCC1 family predicted Fe2+/Mn2+ transporter
MAKEEGLIRGEFLREIVFGANDGVVTSLGFLVGITGAISNQDIIVIAGVLTIVAGAVSMALGNYLGVKAQREFDEEVEHRTSENNPVISGTVMGLAYLVAGLPPLIPFFLFKPTARALVFSVVVAISIMYLIGFIRWTLTRKYFKAKVVETISIGIIAAAIGFLAGEVLRIVGISEPVL